MVSHNTYNVNVVTCSSKLVHRLSNSLIRCKYFSSASDMAGIVSGIATSAFELFKSLESSSPSSLSAPIEEFSSSLGRSSNGRSSDIGAGGGVCDESKFCTEFSDWLVVFDVMLLLSQLDIFDALISDSLKSYELDGDGSKICITVGDSGLIKSVSFECVAFTIIGVFIGSVAFMIRSYVESVLSVFNFSLAKRSFSWYFKQVCDSGIVAGGVDDAHALLLSTVEFSSSSNDMI